MLCSICICMSVYARVVFLAVVGCTISVGVINLAQILIPDIWAGPLGNFSSYNNTPTTSHVPHSLRFLPPHPDASNPPRSPNMPRITHPWTKLFLHKIKKIRLVLERYDPLWFGSLGGITCETTPLFAPPSSSHKFVFSGFLWRDFSFRTTRCFLSVFAWVFLLGWVGWQWSIEQSFSNGLRLSAPWTLSFPDWHHQILDWWIFPLSHYHHHHQRRDMFPALVFLHGGVQLHSGGFTRKKILLDWLTGILSLNWINFKYWWMVSN